LSIVLLGLHLITSKKFETYMFLNRIGDFVEKKP
jgi:hypothetical protein